ncbi:MAG: helix-turn-helix domain-containing protein, partial [Cyanobacteria bacterium]|nr:helix-turn-helix domain-containing protein [Cyanobacteriota bacterium]
AALPPESENAAANANRLQRFTPGSIDVFSSWQGTVLYGAVTLGLIYGLNLQQRQLAAANLLTLNPIPALKPSEQAKAVQAGDNLLVAYPDLRPLERAQRGSGQSALRQPLPAPEGPGVLELNLSQASSLNLSSDGGQRSQLSGSKGQLVLQLQPPLRLSVSPAPKTGEVIWNGKPLAALPKQPEQFQVPAPQPPRP